MTPAPARPASSENTTSSASVSALRDQIAELTVELHELRAEFSRLSRRVETVEQLLK